MWQVVIYGKYETMRFDYATHDEAMEGFSRARKKAAFSAFRIEIEEKQDDLCS